MNKSKFAALLVGLAMAVPAAAQSFYLGGQIGNSEIKQDACQGQVLCDRSDTAWSGHIGYMFTKNWGLELSYQNFGKLLETDDGMGSTTNVKTQAGDAMVVAALPFSQIGLGDGFTAYVKGGAYYAKTKLTSNGTVPDATSTTKQWAWGAGLQYQVFRHLAIRGEWMLYNNLGGKDVGFRGDVQVLSGGVLLTF